MLILMTFSLLRMASPCRLRRTLCAFCIVFCLIRRQDLMESRNIVQYISDACPVKICGSKPTQHCGLLAKSCEDWRYCEFGRWEDKFFEVADPFDTTFKTRPKGLDLFHLSAGHFWWREACRQRASADLIAAGAIATFATCNFITRRLTMTSSATSPKS